MADVEEIIRQKINKKKNVRGTRSTATGFKDGNNIRVSATRP